MSCHRFISGMHSIKILQSHGLCRISSPGVLRRSAVSFRWTSTSPAERPSTVPPATTTKSETLTTSFPPKPFHQRLGPLTTFFKFYSRSQSKSPNKTQFWSAITIYLVADLGAQIFTPRSQDEVPAKQDFLSSITNIDPLRTSRAVIIGAIAAIPAYKWFIFLSHSFNYPSKVLSIFTKVTVNQLVFAPTFVTFYFGMQSALTGGGPKEIWQRITDTVPRSLMSSCFVWPFFQTFNFTMVPMEMRAIASGIFAIGWQAYLSWVNRRAEMKGRNEAIGLVKA